MPVLAHWSYLSLILTDFEEEMDNILKNEDSFVMDSL